MPIVTENHKFPGVYLNHVVDVDNDGCRICWLNHRVTEPESLIISSKPPKRTTPFHYLWIRQKPGRTISFKVLAQFDEGIPGWIVLLYESILMMMLKSYSGTGPSVNREYHNLAVKQLFETLSSSFGCSSYVSLKRVSYIHLTLRGLVSSLRSELAVAPISAHS
jgi:hypothetical protein